MDPRLPVRVTTKLSFCGMCGAESLRRTLEGHSEPVHTVAFSPDGLRIASGSRDGAIILWDIQTGNKLHTLEGHAEPVSSVAFSTDGLTLASAGGTVQRESKVEPGFGRT